MLPNNAYKKQGACVAAANNAAVHNNYGPPIQSCKKSNVQPNAMQVASGKSWRHF
jgi:hypothetical protein